MIRLATPILLVDLRRLPRLIKQSISDSLTSADQTARKPRVLKALSRAPAGHEKNRTPVDSE
jgi:hypothetical protein